MANKKSSHGLYQEAYYPNGTNLYGYSYLQTLQTTNQDLYNQALQFFDWAKGELQRRDTSAPNVEYLRTLAEHERSKEQRLVEELLPGRNLNLQDTGKYLAAINSFLTKKSIFDRNIDRIANIKKVKGKNGNKDSYKGGGAIDISTRFAGFLRSEFDQLDFNDITFESLEKTATRALQKMYTKVTREDKKLSDTSAYIDLANAIEGSEMIQQVLNLYFGTDVISALRGDDQNPPQKLSKAEAENFQSKFGGLMYYDHFKGNLEEFQHKLISDLIATSLKKAGITQETLHTGDLGNQKADIINLINMSVSTKDLEKIMNNSLNENKGEQSVRVKNADMWIKVREKLNQQSGHIIEVTDKNYSLTSESFINNKGFTAQNNFRADHLERLLDRMGMMGGKQTATSVGELMFVLANTGKWFVGGNKAANYEAAELFLATYIGFFLFDDLQVSDLDPELNKDVNANYVHFMNLDGIFIPFSLFLYALYQAFIDITKTHRKDYQDFVNVKIEDNYNKVWKNNDRKLDENDWTTLYQHKLQATTITTHFFGNFVNYIRKEYLNISEI